MVGRRSHGQCLQVVTNDFGGEIPHGQKTTETGRWKAVAVEQVGHQDAHYRGDDDVAYPAYDLRFDRTFVVPGIILVGTWQG